MRSAPRASYRPQGLKAVSQTHFLPMIFNESNNTRRPQTQSDFPSLYLSFPLSRFSFSVASQTLKIVKGWGERSQELLFLKVQMDKRQVKSTKLLADHSVTQVNETLNLKKTQIKTILPSQLRSPYNLATVPMSTHMPSSQTRERGKRVTAGHLGGHGHRCQTAHN